MKKIIVTLFLLIAGMTFAASLNNGNITIEVNGDGDVGLVEYDPVPGSNHVTLVGVNLYYDGSLHDMDYILGTEKLYNNFSQRKMFTGYGRDHSSNFYTYTVSYIEGSNSNLDQTLAYTMRKNTQLKMSYTVDSRVMQTETNDHGSFNIANQTLMFDESSVFLGFAARLNGAKTTSHIYAGFDTVLNWLQTASSTIIEEQNYVNAAGAVAWSLAAVDGTPQIVRTKLMVASSDPEIQPMSTFSDNTPIHIPDTSKNEIKNAKFTQRFNKINKDSIKIKGRVNITEYGTALDNLGNLDVSFMIGDYIAFVPDDGSQNNGKVKGKKLILKMNDGSGKRKLIIKRRTIKGNKYLDYIFTSSKTDISGGTMLTANSPNGKKLDIMLPVTLVLTGNNSQDTEKGGQVWIIPSSMSLEYKKNNEKKARGKLKK